MTPPGRRYSRRGGQRTAAGGLKRVINSATPPIPAFAGRILLAHRPDRFRRCVACALGSADPRRLVLRFEHVRHRHRGNRPRPPARPAAPGRHRLGALLFVIVVSLFPLASARNPTSSGSSPRRALGRRPAGHHAFPCPASSPTTTGMAPWSSWPWRRTLGLVVLGKVVAHWLVSGLPLACWRRCWACSSTFPPTPSSC